ncbi:MAG: GIY-YIG nuclease family protein [Bacteroidales bacterium]|jgi:excinuclease UvrABC nuclease subunit|nr:GIY-YIG nuclease family protein [Bacteroidales bacterium]
MKVFKFLPPYKKDGKTNFPQTVNRTGVYIIKENGVIVYVGFSGYNLYKTMYRHFQSWHHKTQEVISYKSHMRSSDYLVRVIYCTPKQAAALEKALIKKHKPRDNEMKYRIIKMPFVERNYIETVEDIYQETDIYGGLPY